MRIICLDLEGVLIPEIWINVAQRTGIDDLKLTTRDISDYDELMRHRLKVLDAHDLRMSMIQQVIAAMEPLEGAKDFLDELRSRYQVAIVSDTFYEFARPLMIQLGNPTLLAHHLITDDQGRIVDYKLRMADQKRHVVEGFRSMAFSIIAAGDSYNDISMLSAADAGILFKAPRNVIEEYPQFPVVTAYDDLLAEITAADERLGSIV